MSFRWPGIIEKFREFLPVTEKTPVVTLLEGNTPLIEAWNLVNLLNANFKLFLKYEGLNPTGSFKDRGMTLAISKAKEKGMKSVICASTGNTSASAAAYAGRAGLESVVLIPHGAVAMGKLAQALIHGAKVVEIRGNFDDALKLVKEMSEKYPIELVNSLNPFRIEGQKTGAYEICDVLETAPDYHCIPVGNAGNITAYWKGYKDYKKSGKIDKLPKMCGFQAEGAAPIVNKMVIDDPQTIATAIKIGNPASWKQAEKARDESGGLIDDVSDDEILQAYKLLAKTEGVFVEPASAASVAGMIKLNKKGIFKKNDKVVCILTGHGLKDPQRAISSIKKPVLADANITSLKKVLGY
ncbi:MAG: threonine synthase [bacterium]